MLLERILVPLDGSATAEAILPHVRRLLRRRESEIILVQTAVPLVVDAHPGIFEAALEAARSYLRKIEDALSAEGIRVRSVAELGGPADAILRLAEKEHASLIALSTHGRTGLPRAVLGSVAEQVLRRTPVPVVAVRTLPTDSIESAWTERQPVRAILLPLDGSERSLRALPATQELCRLFAARVLLLQVVEPEEEGAEHRGRAAAFLEEIEARVQAQGILATSLVEEGDPADEILDVARFHGVDLIALSTHGRRGVSRLVAGSVTENVLRRTPVPLLVVRSTEAAEDRGREQVA